MSVISTTMYWLQTYQYQYSIDKVITVIMAMVKVSLWLYLVWWQLIFPTSLWVTAPWSNPKMDRYMTSMHKNKTDTKKHKNCDNYQGINCGITNLNVVRKGLVQRRDKGAFCNQIDMIIWSHGLNLVYDNECNFTITCLWRYPNAIHLILERG